METEPLPVTTANGVATVVINRPARKNAITKAMWVELASHVNRLSSEPGVRVIVLRGAGQDFSAGADISEFDTLRGDADSARAYEATNSAAFAALRNCTIPVIAAIRGICFGGGLGLAAACVQRIASPDALFDVPAARLGLASPSVFEAFFEFLDKSVELLQLRREGIAGGSPVVELVDLHHQLRDPLLVHALRRGARHF